jgi:transcriptional accessory protein Tex/SPT6
MENSIQQIIKMLQELERLRERRQIVLDALRDIHRNLYDAIDTLNDILKYYSDEDDSDN